MTKEEAVNVIIKSGCDTNKISDGYHTFKELYDHRIELFLALCKEIAGNPAYQSYKEIWKSFKHSDGSSFDGWFVMGINEEKGKQITYHLPVKYWDSADYAWIKETAPEYDGHSPQDVLKRLREL